MFRIAFFPPISPWESPNGFPRKLGFQLPNPHRSRPSKPPRSSIRESLPWRRGADFADFRRSLGMTHQNEDIMGTYVCMYIYIYIYIYVCICMYVYIYVYMYICIYVYMYICIYVHMYICICICIYVCIYICKIFIYICVYTTIYNFV